MPDEPQLYSRLRALKAKTKQPNSATVLNNWITSAERDMEGVEGGRLGWLVASAVVTAVLQRAVFADGTSRFLLKGGTMLQHRLAVRPPALGRRLRTSRPGNPTRYATRRRRDRAERVDRRNRRGWGVTGFPSRDDRGDHATRLERKVTSVRIENRRLRDLQAWRVAED